MSYIVIELDQETKQTTAPVEYELIGDEQQRKFFDKRYEMDIAHQFETDNIFDVPMVSGVRSFVSLKNDGSATVVFVGNDDITVKAAIEDYINFCEKHGM